MISPKDLREQVIRPTLKDMGMWSEAAENLMMGTAAQETDLGFWLVQRNGGPGRSIYSVEKDTHESLWDHYLSRYPQLASKIRGYVSQHDFTKTPESMHSELTTNLKYATAIARIQYWQRPEPLPDANDILALGEYWDKFYNINDEVGTPEEFVESYKIFVLREK